MHFGIDYGSKIAGTTVICFEKAGKLHWQQSDKKKDADAFIKVAIATHQPTHVFIDAPLSLPAAYYHPAESENANFFFRQCDKELRAMSPMFLGGLTARAMSLQHHYRTSAIEFIEVYPSFLVKTLFENIEIYKKQPDSIPVFLTLLLPELPYPMIEIPTNWHQVDGILAWLSGHRMLNGNALTIGDVAEGVIVI